MPTLTQPQIEMVARAAGLPGDPKVWAAVAMAESSGNTTAKNPSSGTYGLWQIHPVHRKEHPGWTEKWLSDPVNNARAAAVVYASQGWGAWEAYTSGAYKHYLKTTTPAPNGTQVDWWGDRWEEMKKGFDVGPGPEDLFDGGMENDPTLGDIPGISEASGVAEAVQKAGAWMSQPKNWVRVGYVVGGGLLVLLGAYIVASPLMAKAATATPAGQLVKKAAGAVKSSSSKATTAKKPAAKATAQKKES